MSCVKINNSLNWNQLEYYIHVMFNPHCPSLSTVVAFIWFPHSVLISTMATVMVDGVHSMYGFVICRRCMVDGREDTCKHK